MDVAKASAKDLQEMWFHFFNGTTIETTTPQPRMVAHIVYLNDADGKKAFWHLYFTRYMQVEEMYPGIKFNLGTCNL
jgi:hypothetical protein